MKFILCDENRRIIGRYDSDVHEEIPELATEVSEDIFQKSMIENHNYINEKNETSFRDFRTKSEIQEFEKAGINAKAQREILSEYPLWKQNNIQSDYTQYPENEIFKIEFEKMRLFINQVRASADNEVLLLENS